jgi:cell shape-determining protein MreC
MNQGFSYRDRNSARGRRRLVYATVLVIALILADLFSGGGVRSLVRGAVAGVSLTFHSIGTHIAAGGYFTSHASLASENAALKAQVAELEERAALSTALQSQVNSLQTLAHLASAVPCVTAPIASSFIASPYGTFLIGAGINQGVTTGSLVLSGDGVVVGTVASVGSNSATVDELFAPGHSVDAQLDGATVTVKGSGGSNAAAQVPHGITIRAGDAVTAPGFDGRVIGVVGHVDSDPSSAAMKVYIASPVNLSAAQYVYVSAAQK